MTKPTALHPFFTFFGGKWRVAPRYPAPEYDTIVEPFAGSAGYSLRYPTHKVQLYDADPVIVEVWKYLIRVTEREIRALPIDVTHVDELHVPQEAKWLIGFCLNKATVAPHKSPSAWAREERYKRQFWGEVVRKRVASQLHAIRHWKVQCASYCTIPNAHATWFIDPPYHRSGHRYKYHTVDYTQLASYCRERCGQVMVCEQSGATWLPFEAFHTAKAMEGRRGKKVSKEVLWASVSRKQ